jgi:ubiquinol-cytochrome c reductase cytochrome b subunit
MTIDSEPGPVVELGGKVADAADERLGISKYLKNNLNKLFPDHWSFMLGEIALYSFIVLLLTGTYLALFFKPSMVEVTYHGSYIPLDGIKMSEAYASTLNISFDVRGGLLMRQVHHWAALLFVAAITVHLFRVFFTGAFRKPRELNWLIGVGLLTLAILEGFAGYSLPDDLLSGTGLRIAQGIVQSIPVVGTYVSFLLFGGPFPGQDFIPRLYIVHVLLIPGILLGLITAHLMMIWYQKHTQYPGPGRTENNVVGYRLFPIYTAKAGGFFFIVFGVSVVLGAIASINPVWMFGPYTPTEVTAGSQPDWYIGWLDGALRLMPNIEINAWGHTLSLNVLIPALVVPGILFTLLGLYPFIEQWVTGDRRQHNLLDRPRNVPTRTAIGVMSITFYILLWIGGGNDIIATHFSLSINEITWVLRIMLIVLPPIAFVVTRRFCLALQRRDRDKLLHGVETGTIVRLPSGEYIELHQPVSDEERVKLLAGVRYAPMQLDASPDDNGVAPKVTLLDRFRARMSAFYFGEQIPKPTEDELQHGAHHAAELAAGYASQLEAYQGNGAGASERSDGSNGSSGRLDGHGTSTESAAVESQPPGHSS